MSQISELKDRANTSVRAARHLLSEKGSSRWTPAEQATADRHFDDISRAHETLDALEIAMGSTAAIEARAREALDLCIRKSPKAMSAAELRKVKNAMSTTVGAEGGYSVANPIAHEAVSILKGYSGIRQVATLVTTETGATMSFPTTDGTAEVGELLTQNAASSLLDISFASVSIPAYKFGSKPVTVPIELLQDSQLDIIALTHQRALERIGRIQNQKFTVGTGTGEPTGLITAASVGKTGTTGQTLTIIYDDLVDLADSVDAGQGTLGWMMSQTMRKVVRKVKDTGGRPIWTPGFIDGGVLSAQGTLLGYEVHINNDVPVPAANAKSLAFGRLSSYLVRDVVGVDIRRFDDSAFANKGQVGFMAWIRSGGNLLDSTAVKLYQHSAT
jgi:HK97 family phage major capsid protein